MDRKVNYNLNTLSLGANKIDVYRAGNRFYPQMKTSRKVHICLHWFLYPPDNVLLCKAVPIQYYSGFNFSHYDLPFPTYFHVMLLLVNEMFPSEVCQ